MENIASTSCPFCEWYYKLKDMDEYFINNHDGRSGSTEVQYSVALVHKTFYNGYYCGRSSYDFEPLNYYPTCGTKLNK